MITIEQVREWEDKWGMISGTNPGSTSGNGILFTVEYAIGLKRKGLDQTPEFSDELRRISDLISACEIQKGLYKRSPDNPRDQEGFDDYIALGTYSYYINWIFAANILWQGSKYKWLWFIPKYFWNNLNPGKFTIKSWLGRNPAFIAHLKNCAGVPLSLLEKVALMASLLITAVFSKKTNLSGWGLSWHMAKCIPDNNLVKRFWVWRFKKNFSEGMGELRQLYFGLEGNQHPITQLLWQDYGECKS